MPLSSVVTVCFTLDCCTCCTGVCCLHHSAFLTSFYSLPKTKVQVGLGFFGIKFYHILIL